MAHYEKIENVKIFPVRMSGELHSQLKKLAYLTEKPVAELIRMGIQLKLEEYKKVLTNADIAI
jgi:predicted DNA-binding protein